MRWGRSGCRSSVKSSPPFLDPSRSFIRYVTSINLLLRGWLALSRIRDKTFRTRLFRVVLAHLEHCKPPQEIGSRAL